MIKLWIYVQLLDCVYVLCGYDGGSGYIIPVAITGTTILVPYL